MSGQPSSVSLVPSRDPRVIRVQTPGPQGGDGKSAYQVWLDTGHVGTVDQFIASLKGETLVVGGANNIAVVVPQSTPAASWAIPHAFGRLPSVTVYDATGSELIADISATSTMVSVVFATPTAGSAVLA